MCFVLKLTQLIQACQTVHSFLGGLGSISESLLKPCIPFLMTVQDLNWEHPLEKCWCISTPSLHPCSDSSSFEGTSEGLLVQVLLRLGPTHVFYVSKEPDLNTSLVPFVYFYFFVANTLFIQTSWKNSCGQRWTCVCHGHNHASNSGNWHCHLLLSAETLSTLRMATQEVPLWRLRVKGEERQRTTLSWWGIHISTSCIPFKERGKTG